MKWYIEPATLHYFPVEVSGGIEGVFLLDEKGISIFHEVPEEFIFDSVGEGLETYLGMAIGQKADFIRDAKSLSKKLMHLGQFTTGELVETSIPHYLNEFENYEKRIIVKIAELEPGVDDEVREN